MSAADGLIVADKPAGISSHDLVARARRVLGVRRIGHAGTLDPFATGVVLLLVGRATRTQRFFMQLDKTYEVLARLGATSTTGDPEGEIAPGRVPPEPLELPTGTVRQRPPAFSAVKIAGERAYVRARRGEAVVPAERLVEVHEFTQLSRDGDRAAFRIVCSSGTYVRSLIADLHDAYCLELRRTAIGPFSAAGGWSGEGSPRLIGLAAALESVMPRVELGGEEARAIATGRAIGAAADAPDTALLVDAHGPVAIAERRTGPSWRSVVGFRG